jgi:anti-sigma factor (TIGR02949 family)
MDCKRAKELLSAYADRELAVPDALEVERHLAACTDCQREYTSLAALSKAIREHAEYHQAPRHLEKRVLAQLPSAKQPTRRTPALHWNWLNAGAALATIFAVAWSVGLYLALPSDDERLADELVASHVRSLMGDRVADVVSSDQHTVKPWFNGKLDFSPTVNDFAAQGFPLLGGRVDYVHQRPVATLVYRHHKHLVNLYLWPDSARGKADTTVNSKQGYHLIHWTANGTAHWAISDLDVDELRALVRLIQQQPG